MRRAEKGKKAAEAAKAFVALSAGLGKKNEGGVVIQRQRYERIPLDDEHIQAFFEAEDIPHIELHPYVAPRYSTDVDLIDKSACSGALLPLVYRALAATVLEARQDADKGKAVA